MHYSRYEWPLHMTEMGRKCMGRRRERQESHGHDGMHPQVLRELVDILVGLLVIIFEGLWRSGEVPEAWKKANVTSVFQKCKKEDLGSNWPASLNFLGELIIIEDICPPVWRTHKTRR